MRQLILTIVTLASIAVLLLTRNPNPGGKPDIPSGPKENQPTIPVPVVSQSTPTDSNIEKAYGKAQSLTSLEGHYLKSDEKDLIREFEQSKSRLADLNLTKKDDSGQLSEQEALLVLTEIRRQHVLSTLLTKKKIENLRRSIL